MAHVAAVRSWRRSAQQIWYARGPLIDVSIFCGLYAVTITVADAVTEARLRRRSHESPTPSRLAAPSSSLTPKHPVRLRRIRWYGHFLRQFTVGICPVRSEETTWWVGLVPRLSIRLRHAALKCRSFPRRKHCFPRTAHTPGV